MITQQQKMELIAALNSEANNADQSVSFFFDEGDDTPYRIADRSASESFASYEELREAARSWTSRRRSHLQPNRM